jgi:hypothetical protein
MNSAIIPTPFPRKAFHVLAILGLGVISGCSETTEPVSVSGTVKFDKKAIPKGKIAFRCIDANVATVSAEIKDGKYQLSDEAGLIPGKYEVIISAMRKAKRPQKRFETLEGENSSNKVTDEDYIPEKYNNQTELKVTLKAGENGGDEFNFLLNK